MLPPDIHIRREQGGDVVAIRALTRQAFASAKHRDGTEQDIIDRLRARAKLTCSLVACHDGNIVGHIAFSPVCIAGTQAAQSEWYGLGPVSVAPALQGKGIGKALIKRGLAALKTNHNAGGCVVLGDPAHYRKFGFLPSANLTFPHAPAEYFTIQSFDNDMPTGIIYYDAAFGI